MEKYKTLVFKDYREFGKYAHILEGEWCSGEIPRLMPLTASKKGLQQLYPKMDWSQVYLTIVNLQELQTNSA